MPPDFSRKVWHEDIPALYARRAGLSLAEARKSVEAAYTEIGDGRKEWYQISYWFERFGIGDFRPILEAYRASLPFYPEVPEVLSKLGESYTIIACTASTREFLPYLLDGIDRHFIRIFSSISDYGQLKNPEFYRTVCREMRVDPGQVAHVGDSWEFDVVAARAAGIRAYHLNRLERRDGKSLVSLSELVGLLKGQGG